MTSEMDLNQSPIVHVVGGTDHELLSLYKRLEHSGLNTLMLNADQSFRDLITELVWVALIDRLR